MIIDKHGNRRRGPASGLSTPPNEIIYNETFDQDDHLNLQDNQSQTVNTPPRMSKKARKDAKRAARAHVNLNIVTVDDVKKVDQALHPSRSTDPSLPLRSRESSLGVEVNQQDSTAEPELAAPDDSFDFYKPEGRKPRPLPSPANKTWDRALGSESEDKTEAAISMEILTRLGVSTDAVSADKERNTMVALLCKTILNDKTIAANEDAATRTRMEGYWRYVSKKTYEEMKRNNSEWDWQSGMKIVRKPDEQERGDGLGRGDESEHGDADDEQSQDDDDPADERTDIPATSLQQNIVDEGEPLSKPPTADGELTFKFVIPHNPTPSKRDASTSLPRSAKRSDSKAHKTYRGELFGGHDPGHIIYRATSHGASIEDEEDASGYEMDSEYGIEDLLKMRSFV